MCWSGLCSHSGQWFRDGICPDIKMFILILCLSWCLFDSEMPFINCLQSCKQLTKTFGSKFPANITSCVLLVKWHFAISISATMSLYSIINLSEQGYIAWPGVCLLSLYDQSDIDLDTVELVQGADHNAATPTLLTFLKSSHGLWAVPVRFTNMTESAQPHISTSYWRSLFLYIH